MKESRKPQQPENLFMQSKINLDLTIDIKCARVPLRRKANDLSHPFFLEFELTTFLLFTQLIQTG
ncbi:hypothetical protein E5S67_03321 [Microcoleus sp. IPMA8]|uniref:Uncharacterized protein n=1 Tax=Microcoleus asticus IPMA8 TaxID=2563858 RepID=A0ABX2CZ57_9CYAN|nr:hypothetical protein [Microcoleus asticus IPMA8]